jgi:hypothetical protein
VLTIAGFTIPHQNFRDGKVFAQVIGAVATTIEGNIFIVLAKGGKWLEMDRGGTQ